MAAPAHRAQLPLSPPSRSPRNAILQPTVTAHKPAASEAHATVSTQGRQGRRRRQGRSWLTMTAERLTTPLSHFTISAGRTKGQAQVGRPDL